MNAPPRKIPERGLFRLVWVEYNRLRDYVREISPVGGRNIRQRRTLNGTLTIAEPTPASPSEPGVVKQFRVKSVSNDYLTCREFDGTTEDTTDVLVAKPFNLRHTGWHGVTVTYSIESFPLNGSVPNPIRYEFVSPTYRKAIHSTNTTEHQVIIPRYVANISVIFASQSENGTGVSSADWIDLNADARAWARAV